MTLPTVADIQAWLRTTDQTRLTELWDEADRVRREAVGDAVHLRGLLEVSNFCVRGCAYCGLRAPNHAVTRYRMTADEILAGAREVVARGYGTIVLQAGEDYGLSGAWIAALIGRIKNETPLAVTLSLGERPDDELAAWREAGADRYLLRFETSDETLYRLIHPSLPDRVSDRLATLHRLRGLGYEIGGGVMIGIPGQSYAALARDIALFGELDLDMVGVGPYLPHPDTPLGSGALRPPLDPDDQVPATPALTYKVVALTRLVCPEANIPATTALAVSDPAAGRVLGLQRGANVVMPNLTPAKYRALYDVYPEKACAHETAAAGHDDLLAQLRILGRHVGQGPGSRDKR